MSEGNKVSREVPKCSFRFSHREINACEGSRPEGRGLERSYSDRGKKEVIVRMESIDEKTKASGSKHGIKTDRRHLKFVPGLKMFSKESGRVNTERDKQCSIENEIEKIPREINKSQMQTDLGINELETVRKLFYEDIEEVSVKGNEKHQGKIHVHRSVLYVTKEPGFLKKHEWCKGGAQDKEKQDEEDSDEKILGKVKRAKERWNSERQDEGKLNKRWSEREWDKERQSTEQLEISLWDKGSQDEESLNEENYGGQDKGKRDGDEEGQESQWDEKEPNKEIICKESWKKEETDKKGQTREKGRQEEESRDRESYEEGWQDAATVDKIRQDMGKWDEAEQSKVNSGPEELVEKGQYKGRDTCEIIKQIEGTLTEDSCVRVERKRSWKAGRPLTRVDSLKERIRLKEQAAEMDSRREVASPQTFSSSDVTREVGEGKLPVSVPACLSAEKEVFSYTERHGGVTRRKEKEQDEDLLDDTYFPPSSSSSPSLSPTIESHPTMSRIYNLKPVSPRTGGCLTERNSDVQTRRFASGLPKTSVSAPSDSARNKETSPLYLVQRQVEQLNLKKEEVLRHNDGDTQKSTGESIEDQKTEKNQRTSSPQQTVSASQTQFIRSTKRTIIPEKDPVITAPSTPLFTIRSASGGPVRKGNTITITPKKLVSMEKSQAPVTHPKSPSVTSDRPKKRFPTVEEIEVIGGYKNLERSCLVKKRGSTKTLRVCFDDTQLESVFTYPLEDSVVGEEKSPEDWSRTGQGQEDKRDDDDDDDDDGITGKGMSRVLRVDESCRR